MIQIIDCTTVYVVEIDREEDTLTSHLCPKTFILSSRDVNVIISANSHIASLSPSR